MEDGEDNAISSKKFCKKKTKAIDESWRKNTISSKGWLWISYNVSMSTKVSKEMKELKTIK